MSEEWTIGEVAKQTGLSVSALRYYESIGLLLPVRRVSGQRRYRADAISQARLIRFAQQIGFSLDEIRHLLVGFSEQTPPPERWRALAPQKLAEVELLINRAAQIKLLLGQTLRCQCADLEECAVLCDPSALTP